MSNIKIEKNKNPKTKPDTGNLPFGKCFSDHMFLMDYDEGQGWHDPRIVPYAPFTIEPSAMVFHYAQEIFEGLKAYRDDSGSIRLFRPMENVKRLNTSADRMCIPQVPEETAMEGLCELVRLERDWVPGEEGTSLYIRPFIIATESSLGVHSSHSYLFAIITCPVGSYYPEGINPVRIMIETDDVRAVRGGTGYTKCGGNYAASIRAGERAEREGCSQVLWLDGVERKYIEEVGSMNIMFKINGQIVTPILNGSVLSGITRKSCIELMQSWGLNVDERLISVDELMEACKKGTLEEAWGTGTAAVISPVGEIRYGNDKYSINGGEVGEVTKRLYETLTGIQLGRIDDPWGWSLVVDEVD